MTYLDILKKFNNGIISENKRLKSIYSKLLKESEEDELQKEADEDISEKCEAEADKNIEEDDAEKQTDECGDKEVEEADGVSAEEFFKDDEESDNEEKSPKDAGETDEAEEDDVNEDDMVSAEEFFKDDEVEEDDMLKNRPHNNQTLKMTRQKTKRQMSQMTKLMKMTLLKQKSSSKTTMTKK